MSSTDASQPHAARYWPWVLLRAVPAIVVAVIITFSADHSPALGFTMFGVLTLASGLALGLGAFLGLQPGVLRGIGIVQGLVGVIVGLIALLFPGAGVPFLLLLVSAWAVVTGFLELYSGLRSRKRLDSARDWIFAGGLSVVFAVAVLLIPADFTQPFTGPDGVERALTASIILVGMIGAYGAVLGVYLVIAGLSLKWANRSVAAPVAESGN